MNGIKFYSVRQFAENFGVTVACIRRWILIRKISHVKIGRLIRIPESEVNRLIELGYVPAGRGGRNEN
jgi:excisionase family DNA binding protein